MTATAGRNEYRLFPIASTAYKPESWGKPSSPGHARPSPAAYSLAGEVPGWRIIGQIILTVERDDDGHLVTDSFSTVYGDGKTLALAVTDYWNSLINYYRILESAGSGDRSTAQAFRRLRRRLVKTP